MELPAEANRPPSELPVSPPLTEPPVRLLVPCASVLAAMSMVNVWTFADVLISWMDPPSTSRPATDVSAAIRLKFEMNPGWLMLAV